MLPHVMRFNAPAVATSYDDLDGEWNGRIARSLGWMTAC